MKKLAKSEWEEKNLKGPLERFDQKYNMKLRILWDEELLERMFGYWKGYGRGREEFDAALKREAMINVGRVGQKGQAFDTSRQDLRFKRSVISEDSIPLQDGKPEKAAIDTTDPEALTRAVKKVAVFLGADLVGICPLDERWVYSKIYTVNADEKGDDCEVSLGPSAPIEMPKKQLYAIVMAFPENYELIKYSFERLPSGINNMRMGQRNMVCKKLSEFIQTLGYNAIEKAVDITALEIPMAVQAGLGQLGRNGQLVTREFGPRVRLSSVLTDMPLIPDSPVDFGLTEFCDTCKKCADSCPSRAISAGERTAEPLTKSSRAGLLRWQVDYEKCWAFSARYNLECSLCRVSCPYNKVNNWLHKGVGWVTDNIRWADPLVVKMDDLFGYGKPKKADGFWRKWRPV